MSKGELFDRTSQTVIKAQILTCTEEGPPQEDLSFATL